MLVFMGFCQRCTKQCCELLLLGLLEHEHSLCCILTSAQMPHGNHAQGTAKHHTNCQILNKLLMRNHTR